MAEQSTKSFHAKWVLYGAGLGILVSAIAYFGIVTEFKSAPIQYVSLATAFIFAGMLTGYLSDGIVIRESAVAGLVVALATVGLIQVFPGKIETNMITILVGSLFGVFLSYAGAWAGEQMQGEEGVHDNDIIVAGIHFKWVFVGVILGFALNILFSIILSPLYGKSLDVSFYMFCLSTLLMGVSVALFSPGVTIKEPAMAGVIAVLIEWVLVEFVLDLHVEAGNLAIGLGLGFVLTFVGSFVGEKLQKRA
jgi:hypothetical protein